MRPDDNVSSHANTIMPLWRFFWGCEHSSRPFRTQTIKRLVHKYAIWKVFGSDAKVLDYVVSLSPPLRYALQCLARIQMDRVSYINNSKRTKFSNSNFLNSNFHQIWYGHRWLLNVARSGNFLSSAIIRSSLDHHLDLCDPLIALASALTALCVTGNWHAFALPVT